MRQNESFLLKKKKTNEALQHLKKVRGVTLQHLKEVRGVTLQHLKEVRGVTLQHLKTVRGATEYTNFQDPWEALWLFRHTQFNRRPYDRILSKIVKILPITLSRKFSAGCASTICSHCDPTRDASTSVALW